MVIHFHRYPLSRTKIEAKNMSQKSPNDHIHHVAISVPNIAQAVEWYTSKFNCRVEYRDETWALLEFANTKLALVLPTQHPAHFAIARPDATTSGKLVGHRDGLQSVYITDPFGNAVEVLQETSKPATPST